MDTLMRVLDWPPIIQGAIGSAVFWLLLLLGQNATGRFARFGTITKKEGLYRELIQEKMMRQHLDVVVAACMYQALSYLTRGAIFLGLGSILASAIPVLFTVGGVGFIYYAYGAARW